MKKSVVPSAVVICSFVALSSLLCCSCQATEYLRVGENAIVNSEGASVALRGFNLGGWLVYQQELFYSKGNLWDFAAPNEFTIASHLDTTAGTGSGERYLKGIKEQWVTEKDVEYLAQLGVNVVRVGLAHWHFAGQPNDTVAFHYLDTLIQWATNNEVYVLVDMHAAPGCQTKAVYCSQEQQVRLWDEGQSYKQDFIALWTRIAHRYSNSTTLLGYDLLHAPEAASDVALETIYKDTILAIRGVDTNHIIFVQGNNKGTDFGVFKNRWVLAVDSNTAYSMLLFQYSDCPYLTDYQKEIDKYIDTREKIVENDGLPIFIAEFGGICSNWIQAAVAVLQSRENLNPAVYWTYKGITEDDDSDSIHEMDDKANWDNLIGRLDRSEFATDLEWNNGFEALQFDNFKAREDRIEPLQKFFNGEDVTYSYNDAWILGVGLALVLLVAIILLGLVLFLWWRKRKNDPFHGF